MTKAPNTTARDVHIARTSPTILVLDGHDATGKTTLATCLANAIGARYVRPFAGEAGAQLLQRADQGDFDGVSALAREAVRAATYDASGVLVFDRHWMTVFSLVSERLWPDWEALPPTLLCWVDLPTTLARLGARDEEPRPVEEHEHYLGVYRQLAKRFNCEMVRTDLLTPGESLEQVVRWAEERLRKRPTASR